MEKLQRTGAVWRLVLATMLTALAATPAVGKEAGPLVRTLRLSDVFLQVEVDAIHRYHLARIQLARVLGRVETELTQR